LPLSTKLKEDGLKFVTVDFSMILNAFICAALKDTNNGLEMP
jgi:hypothetical protein